MKCVAPMAKMMLSLLPLLLGAQELLAEEPAPANAPFDAAQAQAHQQAWARALGCKVATTNSQGTTLVVIPPGEFLMGSSDQQVETAIRMAAELEIDERTQQRIRTAERPQHRMTIERPFLLATTEVTIRQFRQFVKETGYVTDGERLGTGNSAAPEQAVGKDRNEFTWRTPGFAQREDAAVSQVSWNDAVAFCNWLSEREKLPAGYRMDAKAGWEPVPGSTGYRLPSEAEWEFACRAGTTTQFHFGDDHRQLEKYAWFNFKSGSTPVREVGTKLPNPFGLYDMHGNIGEWCGDFFEMTSYPKHLTSKGGDASTPPRRAIRGGDWWANGVRARSAFRGYGDQISRSDDLGFRLARSQ